MGGVAFFDLDRTITSINVGAAWVRTEFGAGRIPAGLAARYGVWLARFALGLSGAEEVMHAAIATLAGERESELHARTRAFFAAHVQGRYRPGALSALAAHRSRGDSLALLTSASHYVAEEVARELDIPHVFACHYEVGDDGHLTGRARGRLCVGDGKRELAAECARSAGTTLDRCSFYTDSIADLAALEAVGTPVAVHPDRKLARVASQRGWAIVDWGT